MLSQAVEQVFSRLITTLEQLNSLQFVLPCKNLFHATVGQHVRHVIELFQCLHAGYDTGVVNYENRKRDHLIETDKAYAVYLLKEIGQMIDRPDKKLNMLASYDENTGHSFPISTNYYREIAYNLEHTIHHMALIRIGILEVADISVPENFGVAPSTTRYKAACAQ